MSLEDGTSQILFIVLAITSTNFQSNESYRTQVSLVYTSHSKAYLKRENQVLKNLNRGTNCKKDFLTNGATIHRATLSNRGCIWRTSHNLIILIFPPNAAVLAYTRTATSNHESYTSAGLLTTRYNYNIGRPSKKGKQYALASWGWGRIKADATAMCIRFCIYIA